MPATIPFVVHPEREGSFPGFPLSGKFMQTALQPPHGKDWGHGPKLSVTSLRYWGKYGMERGLCWKQHCVLTPVMAMAGEAGPEFRSGSAASPWGWGGAAGEGGPCLMQQEKEGRQEQCLSHCQHGHTGTQPPLLLCQAVRLLTAPA